MSPLSPLSFYDAIHISNTPHAKIPLGLTPHSERCHTYTEVPVDYTHHPSLILSSAYCHPSSQNKNVTKPSIYKKIPLYYAFYDIQHHKLNNITTTQFSSTKQP
jgi:hypothetical protein